MFSRTPAPLLYLAVLGILLPSVLAQFGNFFQGGFPFGHGHGHAHGRGGQEQGQGQPRREFKGWAEMETGEYLGRSSKSVFAPLSWLAPHGSQMLL